MFKLNSKYAPTGDQPKAIEEIVRNFNNNVKRQTLLGATGTGKTFTMANVITKMNKPTLILAHNKTLAGQLYNEMKELFGVNIKMINVDYDNKLYRIKEDAPFLK